MNWSSRQGREKVAIVKIKHGNPASIFKGVTKVIELVNGLGIDDNDTVLIKININSLRTEETGSITDRRVLNALLKYLRINYRNLKIIVAESNATGTDATLYFKWLGYPEVIEKWNASFLNLSKDELVKKKIDGLRFKEIKVSKTLAEANYFISLAKLKTHLLTKVTGVLKNQFGAIPYRMKIHFHDKLDEAIVDANIAMKPDFGLIDGVIAMESERGPTYGQPLHLNLLIGGKDPVATDTVAAKVMGFHPYLIGHIRKASHKGVGRMDYEIVGEDLDSVKRKFKYNYLISKAYRIAYHFRKRETGRINW